MSSDPLPAASTKAGATLTVEGCLVAVLNEIWRLRGLRAARYHFHLAAARRPFRWAWLLLLARYELNGNGGCGRHSTPQPHLPAPRVEGPSRTRSATRSGNSQVNDVGTSGVTANLPEGKFHRHIAVVHDGPRIDLEPHGQLDLRGVREGEIRRIERDKELAHHADMVAPSGIPRRLA